MTHIIEFTRPLPSREDAIDPVDPRCGHRHPTGEPCWAMDGGDEIGEPCVHAARCVWCGNSIQMNDNHRVKRASPDVRIHKECIAEWEAAGEPATRGAGR